MFREVRHPGWGWHGLSVGTREGGEASVASGTFEPGVMYHKNSISMSFSFRVCAFLIGFPLVSFAGMTLTGEWEAENPAVPKGEHVLRGECHIPRGKRMEIAAGALIIAEKGASLRVEGDLVISGQANLPVVFKGVRWAGIRSEAGAKLAVKGLQICGAEFALNVQGGVGSVDDSVFYKNIRGLKLDGTGEVTVTNCLFSTNTEYGARFARMTGSFEHCSFVRNKGAGIVLGDASPKFLYCLFTDNGIGIEQNYDGGLVAAACSFEGAGVAVTTLAKKGELSFRRCWWGARTTALLEGAKPGFVPPCFRVPASEKPKPKKGDPPPPPPSQEDALLVRWDDFLKTRPEKCGAIVTARF